MSEVGVFFYCLAMGFVTAATVASFYQWVTSQRADFSVREGGPGGLVIMVVLSAFCGPFIVVQKVLAGLRTNEINGLLALAGVIVAGMWSVCAGIFYVSLLLSA